MLSEMPAFNTESIETAVRLGKAPAAGSRLKLLRFTSLTARAAALAASSGLRSQIPYFDTDLTPASKPSGGR